MTKSLQYNLLNVETEVLPEINEHYVSYLQSTAEKILGSNLSRTGLLEFLKFFLLSTSFPESKIQISDAIDKIWHAAIIETRQYRILNDRFNNGFFLDHTVLDLRPDIFINEQAITQSNFDFAVNYFLHFGEFTSESIELWPQVSSLGSKYELNCVELNTVIALACKDFNGANINLEVYNNNAAT
ncbi:MAG: hypothetical protein RL189_2502 [Pseudomonadota bacterium]